MATYRIHFDRIGRTFRDQTVEFENVRDGDADHLAEGVFAFARRHLVSREFQVLVDLKADTVSIDAGRFGTGTILEPTVGIAKHAPDEGTER